MGILEKSFSEQFSVFLLFLYFQLMCFPKNNTLKLIKDYLETLDTSSKILQTDYMGEIMTGDLF